MVSPPSRRDALRLTGVGLAAALPGCSGLSSSRPRYSLLSGPSGGTTLVDLFSWEPVGRRLHVRRNVDGFAASLLDSGTLTTAAQPIAPYAPDVEPTPAYAEHQGASYRVRVTDVEDASLDRWEFWFEPVGDPPSDADVVENPTDGRSALDAQILEWAINDAIGAVVGDEDLSAAPPGDRGVVYFEPMDPGESDLVPEPPFEYAAVEPDTELLDRTQTLRAHAERASVETKRYVHGTERVADSRSGLVDVLADHVDATFDDPAEGVGEIVTEISHEGVYAEREPISEPFERVLARLAIEDPSPPDAGEDVRTWRRHYEYDGDYYGTTFRIRTD